DHGPGNIGDYIHEVGDPQNSALVRKIEIRGRIGKARTEKQESRRDYGEAHEDCGSAVTVQKSRLLAVRSHHPIVPTHVAEPSSRPAGGRSPVFPQCVDCPGQACTKEPSLFYFRTMPEPGSRTSWLNRCSSLGTQNNS